MPTAATAIFGAGDGADAASNTILDQQQTASSTVLFISGSGNRTLSGLRITGGTGLQYGGGGITSQVSPRLTIDGCTITDNAGPTGGLDHGGPLTMTNSRILDNIGGANLAGGLRLAPLGSNQASTIESTIIDGNSAGRYGGLYFDTSNSTQTLAVASSTSFTNNTFTGSSGSRAGAIGQGGVTNGSVTVNGATFSGNSTPQCAGAVNGCPS